MIKEWINLKLPIKIKSAQSAHQKHARAKVQMHLSNQLPRTPYFNKMPVCLCADINFKGSPHRDWQKKVGDIDNLIAFILDSANEILFNDDNQVCELHLWINRRSYENMAFLQACKAREGEKVLPVTEESRKECPIKDAHEYYKNCCGFRYCNHCGEKL